MTRRRRFATQSRGCPGGGNHLWVVVTTAPLSPFYLVRSRPLPHRFRWSPALPWFTTMEIEAVMASGREPGGGAIVLPDVFTASHAFVSANRCPRQRAQRT